jgi:cytosine/adenosine deaminase-related metal-dependent hydrolase
MGTLLVRNARVLVTMDDARREIARGEMRIRDGFIEAVGERNSLPPQADEVVDLTGHIVLPGLINTHHHLYQSLDRAWPASQDKSLTEWLQGLYPRWEKLTPETIAGAVELGLAEIVLSGCTTVADHQYLWPNGLAASTLFEIAAKFGIRFHLGRGGQNIGRAQGGFAAESLVEDADHILAHTADLIARFHDARPGSFRQVFVAPSSLRSVTAELLGASAVLASEKGVQLHFHLGETAGEIDFALQRYGKRPVQVAQELGCLTAQTWLAHGVHFDAGDVAVLRRCGCGICHCPSSNMRLGSGIAPVRHYLDNAITVGLGVDGSASNDSSNLLSEIRTALLLSRLAAESDSTFLSARMALEMATRNGAKLLGRNDIGRLAPGYAADFIAIDSRRVELAGSEDPVAALAFCVLTRVDHSWVHGKRIVSGGRLVGVNLETLINKVCSDSRSDS